MKYIFLLSGIAFGIGVATGHVDKITLILAGAHIIVSSLGSFARETLREIK